MRIGVGLRLAGAALLGLFLGPLPGHAAAVDKPTLGPAAEVLLLPWGIRVQARVDTGAATSSLDARVISITGRKGAQTVRFKLMGDAGATVVELPVADVHRVRTSDAGRAERRPTVELEMCVAGRRFVAEVNLNDRSRMEYRMLLGRNALEGRFVVDVEQTAATPAACPGEP
jgi:hypothetical protein